MHTLKSNIWKMRIYLFSQRRAYVPILSIYFLTLPDTHLQQIGIYTSLGTLAGFLFEIPSGYFSDYFGHKKTLIIAKTCMVIASFSFIIGTNFWWFVLGSVCISLGFAFESWAGTAFMHETLEELWQEQHFTKIWGRIRGNVSLANAGLIIALPFLTKITFLLPFQIGLGFDIIGLIVALLFVTPKIQNEKLSTNRKNTKKHKSLTKVWKTTKQTQHTGFWPIANFSIILGAVMWALSTFRSPYLESIGFPIIYLGFIMWGSRVIRFLTSRIVHIIEKKLPLKQLFFIETGVFSLGVIAIIVCKNPWVVGIIIALIDWYRYWRSSIIIHHLINKIPNKKYKATLLSVQQQIMLLLQVIIVFILGGLVEQSYILGFWFLAGILIIGLPLTLVWLKKSEEK